MRNETTFGTLEVLRAIRDMGTVKDATRQAREALVLRGDNRAHFYCYRTQEGLCFDTRLAPHLERCIAMAGTLERCGELIRIVEKLDVKAITSVSASRQLGPYLAKCFTGWMQTYGAELTPAEANFEVSE